MIKFMDRKAHKKEFVFFDDLNTFSRFKLYAISTGIIQILLAYVIGFQSKLFSGVVEGQSVLLLSKHYWFKKYVDWNSKIIALKLSYFKTITIHFKKVISIKITEKHSTYLI